MSCPQRANIASLIIPLSSHCIRMWTLFIHGCQSDQSTAYSYIASNQLKKRATKCNELLDPKKCYVRWTLILDFMDGCTGLAERNHSHILQNLNVKNTMRKFVQFTFLNLLCREHKEIKLCNLFLHCLPKYNSSVLHCIEYSEKTAWVIKNTSVSHHAYIHEPWLSHNMRKSSLWTDHVDAIRQITRTIYRAIKLTACTLPLSIMLHCVSVPLSDVLPVVS